MSLIDLVTQFGGLAGVAAVFALIVNILKHFGKVDDGSAPTASLILNVIGFIAFVAIGAFRPSVDFGVVNAFAETLAQLGLMAFGLFLQLKTSQGTHDAVRGTPVIGTSHSLRRARSR